MSQPRFAGPIKIINGHTFQLISFDPYYMNFRKNWTPDFLASQDPKTALESCDKLANDVIKHNIVGAGFKDCQAEYKKYAIDPKYGQIPPRQYGSYENVMESTALQNLLAVSDIMYSGQLDFNYTVNKDFLRETLFYNFVHNLKTNVHVVVEKYKNSMAKIPEQVVALEKLQQLRNFVLPEVLGYLGKKYDQLPSSNDVPVFESLIDNIIYEIER